MMPNLKAITKYVDLGCAIGAILDLDREHGAKDECTHETIQMCKRVLDGLPAIEYEPVRHGRWLQTQEPLGWHEVDCFECSNCHESWILDEDYSFDEITWKYCPNCGARMDGESE